MCPQGQGDCDTNPLDCETDLTSATSDCGFCDNVCAIANGTPTCMNSACAVAGCNSGFANCDANEINGCEVTLATNLSNCGTCGTACTNARGSTSCIGGSCRPVCTSGWGSCDSDPRNGCETALNTASDCGTCGNVCPSSLPNAAPACNSGVCGYSCNALGGVYALKLVMQVGWPSTQYVRAGSGTAQVWIRLAFTQSGTALSGSVALCGQTLPQFANSVTSDRYLYSYPNALFDTALPTASFSGTLASTNPGAGLSSSVAALLLGINMSDPVNGSWPSPATARSNQVDHDADTEVGVTVSFVDNSTYNHVQTTASFSAARASHAYKTERLRFSLAGAFSGCSGASGPATVQSLDTRTIGCRLASSGGDCNSSQYSHLESNAPVYSVSSATYSMTKLGNVGATFTCAQVRAAL